MPKRSENEKRKSAFRKIHERKDENQYEEYSTEKKERNKTIIRLNIKLLVLPMALDLRSFES